MTAASPAPHNDAKPSVQRPRTGRAPRLLGVDLARFVAVFGMFVIHFGAPFSGGAVELALAGACSGRATALFTFLAGVSLAMLTGRRTPLTGQKLRDARKRIAVRAVLLVLIGLLLATCTDATGFLLTVIIPFYGAYFLLALPFVGMRARGLAISAVLMVALGPQVSYLLRAAVTEGSPVAMMVEAVNSIDPGHLIGDLGVLDLLLLDFYPATSYLALVLAGLAVGRLDLRSGAVRLRLALGGAGLAALTYTVSALLAGRLPDVLMEGTVPVGHPEFLLAARAHSGSSFELLGSLGVAVAVLAGCLELADRAGRAVSPLVKAGSMALTLYALHALVMAWQVVVGGWPLSGVPETLANLASMGQDVSGIPDFPAFPPDGHRPVGFVAFLNMYMPELFLLFSIGFAVLWKQFFRRGPLEGAVSSAVDAFMARTTRSA
ncbi:DUF1624 domain-containing protein [Saccharopolyspora sp. HNM0986]|uniref:heparan-alpha-glucosaminide N-acetyltransferase domain-containing protein n=1 Tax=Saccharopolyspora galaxeae TaxID=2781241 RepID=UPI0019093CBD|nr:heparan-alpha-glucosaminide N-acetyltransferase domain-containing protein [Saccharopolyspora sp. HNM0986]MBK0868168.1 DUF1624 domain-containing protein [Saccharopolyspora sp. HNM0986]